MTVVEIEFVEHGEEFGFFGKVVAKTIVAGMNDAEREAEVAVMRDIVGHHCIAVEVEHVAVQA